VTSALRFLRHYLRPDAGATSVIETTYLRQGERVPASVYRPARTRGRLPGWVVLHGLTYTGREHPSLVRFAQAVAATGCVVLVPDIPEWRALRVAPAITVPTIQAAIRTLHDRDDVRPDNAGLIGFSFGATQGLVAAADPDVARLLHGMVAWGGYHDLRRLFHFGLTGEFMHDGSLVRLQPDPYGSWVMAASYLTHVPGHENHGAVALALRELALESGRRRSYAWEPIYDASKVRLRETLSAEERELFDRFAPLTTTPRTVTSADAALARGLADAAARVDPLLAPAEHLPRIRVPTLLAHGRDDRLVPFTESVALAEALPPQSLRGLTITGLFQHSGGTQKGLGPVGLVREGVRFVAVLQRMLRIVV
jgi:pimeloyl-ACP methyl ester carboxylesterase